MRQLPAQDRLQTSIIKHKQENMMAEFTLLIDGMHCGSCIRRVSQALSSVENTQVEEVRLGAARLKSSNGQTTAETAINALSKAGYTARLDK